MCLCICGMCARWNIICDSGYMRKCVLRILLLSSKIQHSMFSIFISFFCCLFRKCRYFWLLIPFSTHYPSTLSQFLHLYLVQFKYCFPKVISVYRLEEIWQYLLKSCHVLLARTPETKPKYSAWSGSFSYSKYSELVTYFGGKDYVKSSLYYIKSSLY